MENKVSIEVNAHDVAAIEAILKQVEYARHKHALNHSDMSEFEKANLLTEEYLEAIRDLNDCNLTGFKIELAQVAAVVIRNLSGV